VGWLPQEFGAIELGFPHEDLEGAGEFFGVPPHEDLFVSDPLPQEDLLVEEDSFEVLPQEDLFVASLGFPHEDLGIAGDSLEACPHEDLFVAGSVLPQDLVVDKSLEAFPQEDCPAAAFCDEPHDELEGSAVFPQEDVSSV
jgi:hypothetical protein